MTTVEETRSHVFVLQLSNTVIYLRHSDPPPKAAHLLPRPSLRRPSFLSDSELSERWHRAGGVRHTECLRSGGNCPSSVGAAVFTSLWTEVCVWLHTSDSLEAIVPSAGCTEVHVCVWCVGKSRKPSPRGLVHRMMLSKHYE